MEGENQQPEKSAEDIDPIKQVKILLHAALTTRQVQEAMKRKKKPVLVKTHPISPGQRN